MVSSVYSRLPKALSTPWFWPLSWMSRWLTRSGQYVYVFTEGGLMHTWLGLDWFGLTSLCHSNGHIETMSAREINPFTALTRIRAQFLMTQWSTSNHSEWTRLRLRPLSHRGWLHKWVGTTSLIYTSYGLWKGVILLSYNKICIKYMTNQSETANT